MPQLVKGGKWVFGWAVVGQENEIRIPPMAYNEYSFQMNEPVVFTGGSRRSGGFGLGRRRTITSSIIHSRIVEEGVIGEQMRVVLPGSLDIKPGEQLLVVRGSNLVLGFVQFGPIYEEALRHPEIEVFTP